MNDYKRVLLVVLGAILLIPVGFSIQGAINSNGEKNARMFNTAIQATETDRFNYTIDSHQGKLLGSGAFTPTQLVKFPEMSKQFAWVEKSKQEYTMHTREDCTTDSDGNETCTTETYYTWDFAGSDEVSTPAYKLHGREYPASIFSVGNFKHSAEACDFTPANTAGWFSDKNGCDGSYWYTDSDTRYYYDVIDPAGFTAAMIADVSDGTLKPVQGSTIDLQPKSVEQMQKEANDYKTPGIVFLVFWWILVLGGMGAVAYAWSMNDERWE